MQAQGGGAPGFDRGFDEYNANFHSRQAGEDRYSSIERRADKVVAAAAEWIDKNTKSPFFVWIHLYDPHAPYEPPEPFATRFRVWEHHLIDRQREDCLTAVEWAELHSIGDAVAWRHPPSRHTVTQNQWWSARKMISHVTREESLRPLPL